MVFVMALSIALVAGPIADALGKRFKIVSVMGGRRVNDADSRGGLKLGGLCLLLSFTITVLLAQFLPVPHLDPYETIRLIGLLLGGSVIFVVGVLDDIYQFKGLNIFIGQSIAAGIAIAFQIFIEYFNNPITGQQTIPWAYIVTVTLSYF